MINACPFCMHEVADVKGLVHGLGYMVQCPNCLGSGPISNINEEEAIAFWNGEYD
jgi:hypothetical protein